MNVNDEVCDICDKPEDSTDPIIAVCMDCYKKIMQRAHEDLLAEAQATGETQWH